MTILFSADPMTVGSHRDSRESMRRKTASWELMSSFRVLMDEQVVASSAWETGWPGIGMERLMPVAF